MDNVSFFVSKGALVIRFVDDGGYAPGKTPEVRELIADMAKDGTPISRWTLWVDGLHVEAKETYTGKELLAMVTKAKDVSVVAVGRKGKGGTYFKVPVLKLSGEPTAKASSTRRGR